MLNNCSLIRTLANLEKLRPPRPIWSRVSGFAASLPYFSTILTAIQNSISVCSEMVEVLLLDMPTIQITATIHSSGKRVRIQEHQCLPMLIEPVCVSDALVAEIKRIVKESEILRYVWHFGH